MNKSKIMSIPKLLILCVFVILSSCNSSTDGAKTANGKTVYPSDVTPFFKDFKLILGDGSNVGHPIDFENKDYFFAKNDGKEDWVVYIAPNAGNTHGTSNNIRTELAQAKKWSPMTGGKMTATCKVMNVSPSGDPSVAATYSVVIGQIHSADGHENEPFKLFYKKFPGHKKGSVFWNYEINTAGDDDNSGRWDYSYPIWGYDFSVVGADANTTPPEPKDGIELGEEISYEVVVKDGIMSLKFMSEGHETKTFTKNLIKSEYATKADMPEQVKGLFVPIGQDGVEREEA